MNLLESAHLQYRDAMEG